jgi:hypothetical protein
MNGAREGEVNIMIQFYAAIVAMKRGGLKNYMLAIVLGSALGGAYVVATPPGEARPQGLSLWRSLAHQPDGARLLRADDDGALQAINRKTVAEPVRSWAI